MLNVKVSDGQPNTVYLTDELWGDQIIVSEEEIPQLIVQLSKAMDDFRTIAEHQSVLGKAEKRMEE